MAVASSSVDPFAELDDMAAKIKLENSNYPNSISPLPTYKKTERELISDNEDDIIILTLQFRPTIYLLHQDWSQII